MVTVNMNDLVLGLLMAQSTSEVAAVLRGLAAALNCQYDDSGAATPGIGSGGSGGDALGVDGASASGGGMMAKFLAVRAGIGKRPAKRQAVESVPPRRRALRVWGLSAAPADDISVAGGGDVLVWILPAGAPVGEAARLARAVKLAPCYAVVASAADVAAEPQLKKQLLPPAVAGGGDGSGGGAGDGGGGAPARGACLFVMPSEAMPAPDAILF
eukprot:scaffold7107_cov140-Isochrysis_galbana.AAC.1